MSLSLADRLAIHELLSLHGHCMDEREFDLLDDLFTPNVVYDLQDFGAGVHQGIETLRALATGPSRSNPIAHHVTNVVIGAIEGETVRVRSKGLGVLADGKVGSVVYEDRVVRTPGGWRITHRIVTGRRALSPDAREP